LLKPQGAQAGGLCGLGRGKKGNRALKGATWNRTRHDWQEK
jgi:hypothetical protein